jgi:hypothetical protein
MAQPAGTVAANVAATTFSIPFSAKKPLPVKKRPFASQSFESAAKSGKSAVQTYFFSAVYIKRAAAGAPSAKA